MAKQIDTKAIEEHIRGILIALGDDPDREGLKETPKRVASMYEEVFEGMNYTNEEIGKMFDKTFENDLDIATDSRDMVVVRDIDIFSYCEHHLALMYDMKVSVAYIPNGKVIGLSKIARISDMVSKRLQLQERIGSDIADIMSMVTDSDKDFLNLLTDIERISDICSNIGIAIVTRSIPEIGSQKHEYVSSLHKGNDEQFNIAYKEIHDKYFDKLKAV